jgi:hypothetical protein
VVGGRWRRLVPPSTAELRIAGIVGLRGLGVGLWVVGLVGAGVLRRLRRVEDTGLLEELGLGFGVALGLAGLGEESAVVQRPPVERRILKLGADVTRRRTPLTRQELARRPLRTTCQSECSSTSRYLAPPERIAWTTRLT